MSKPINEMTLDELSAYAVTLPGWRWAEGMLTRCRVRVTDGGEDYIIGERPCATVNGGGHIDTIDISGFTPDLTDPATIGCLMALVREACDDPTLHVAYWPSPDMGGRQWAVKDGGMRSHRFRFITEAHALIAALAAAPAKEPK